MHEVQFDLVDVVDIILEVERHFHFTIPDEAPVDTVGDLMHYIRGHCSYKAAPEHTAASIPTRYFCPEAVRCG